MLLWKRPTQQSTGNRCPCANSGKPCDSLCNCLLCENSNRRRFETTVKKQTCRCGETNKSLDKQLCLTSLCVCQKFAFSCNDEPQCHCKQCDNVHGARVKLDSTVTKKRKCTDRVLLVQTSAGKLPRMSSDAFF
jgi:hypothetical protein